MLLAILVSNNFGNTCKVAIAMTFDPLDSLTESDLQELAAIEDELGPENGIFAISPDWFIRMDKKEGGKVLGDLTLPGIPNEDQRSPH